MYGNDTTALGTALPFTGAALAGNITLALVLLFAGLAILTMLAVGKRRRDVRNANTIASREALAVELGREGETE